MSTGGVWSLSFFCASTNTFVFPSTSVCFFSYQYCSPISTSAPLNSWSKIARLIKQNFLVKRTPLVSGYSTSKWVTFSKKIAFFADLVWFLPRFESQVRGKNKSLGRGLLRWRKKWQTCSLMGCGRVGWWARDNSSDDSTQQALRRAAEAFFVDVIFSFDLAEKGLVGCAWAGFFQWWRMKEKTNLKKAVLATSESWPCMEGSCDLSRVVFGWLVGASGFWTCCKQQARTEFKSSQEKLLRGVTLRFFSILPRSPQQDWNILNSNGWKIAKKMMTRFRYCRV